MTVSDDETFSFIVTQAWDSENGPETIGSFLTTFTLDPFLPPGRYVLTYLRVVNKDRYTPDCVQTRRLLEGWGCCVNWGLCYAGPGVYFDVVESPNKRTAWLPLLHFNTP